MKNNSEKEEDSESSKKESELQNDLKEVLGVSDSEIESISVTNDHKALYVDIRLIRKEGICPDCGCASSNVKGYTIKKITHPVLAKRPLYILYHARRLKCTQCGKTFYEDNPFVFPGEKISVMGVYNIITDLRFINETYSSVARRYFVSVTTVQRVFDQHVNIPRQKLTKRLVFDEVAAMPTSEGQYMFVIMDFDTLDIIDVLPSRKKDDLIRYFSRIPLEERESVEFIASDLWYTYRAVAKMMFPNCRFAIDQFHLLSVLNSLIDKVRQRAVRRNDARGISLKDIKDPKRFEEIKTKKKNYYILKKFHWMTYKYSDDPIFDPNIEKKYNRVLEGYYNYNDIFYALMETDDDLCECFALKEQLKIYLDGRDFDKSCRNFNDLADAFRTSGVKEMKDFGKTLMTWKSAVINSTLPVVISKEKKKEILAYEGFSPEEKALLQKVKDEEKSKTDNKHMNSSVIEARNRCIKVIKDLSCGYGNFSRFRNRILWCLSKKTTAFLYPQPISDDRINLGKKRGKYKKGGKKNK
jgi:transposase